MAEQIAHTKNEKIEQFGRICFYAGLLLELLIVILDKSSWINPLEGQMFRVSFLLFACKLCVTKYSKKEWLAVLVNEKLKEFQISRESILERSFLDEAVRAVVFVASMKGIDHKKALRVVFYVTLTGMAVLAMLSLAGVLGEVWDAGAGYGIKEGSRRLCLGVGNSNALAIMIWALMTLGVYLFHEKMKPAHWMLLGVLTVGVYAATMTRTTFLIMAATLVLAFVMDKSSKIREGSVVYIGGMAAVAAGFVFSLYAAHISNWYELMPAWVVRIDRILTGRISSIYAFENGGGVLRNWKLFGDPNYVEYFDMGYVRLFFWYGIIPGACCMVLLFFLMRVCRTLKDTQGFVLVLSFALFTVVEAHAVSVYLARNYVLFLLGAYWTAMLPLGGEAIWWWQLPGAFWKHGSKAADGSFGKKATVGNCSEVQEKAATIKEAAR